MPSARKTRCQIPWKSVATEVLRWRFITTASTPITVLTSAERQNTRLISKFPARLEAAKTRKAETLEQLANAKTEVLKPFAYEDGLKEKTDRLNALNIELNLDEKDTPVMDTEPEQENEQPEKRTQDRER